LFPISLSYRLVYNWIEIPLKTHLLTFIINTTSQNGGSSHLS
jgi:hypothetical protein